MVCEKASLSTAVHNVQMEVLCVCVETLKQKIQAYLSTKFPRNQKGELCGYDLCYYHKL